MSTGLQKVLKRSTKSSKSQENAQKVPKVLRPQVLNWSSKCPQIPQKVIKALEVLRGPQKVFKSKPRSPQKVINVVKILWSSKVPQMFIKWSSKSPQKFLNTVLKWSTRSQQKVLKSSSTFWDTQVLLQKVLKTVLKRSKNAQKGPHPHLKKIVKSQSPQKFTCVLNSSVGSQVREDPQCPEKSLNSSKASGPQ